MESKAKIRSFTNKNVISTISAKATIIDAMKACVALHGEEVLAEIQGFDLQRQANPDGWAKLCLIKAILSPGVVLDNNIAAAKKCYAALIAGKSLNTFEQFAAIIAGVPYGSKCYGNNVRSLIASWDMLSEVTENVMTWDGLTALVEGKYLAGLGLKTRNWALALYDASHNGWTLDRHMLRGILSLIGDVSTDELRIGPKAYRALNSFLTATFAETDIPVGPLVAQWSMWNEFRHDGTHASHAALFLP